MAIIEVEGLEKDFMVRERAAGFLGSVRSLFAPTYRRVRAVSGITFAVEEGEILSFIGPNGAGKSTTLKMLTGILLPSAGAARVLDRVPWTSRTELAGRIGAVFGQKSQLWFHLPPRDTFDLLARVYRLEPQAYRERLDMLVELFELAPFLGTATRKLSLGQRMRAEIAASVLHRPRVLFLDEPTIGLDVVAKASIRTLIQRINREDGVTVILTSHDVGDMEKLSRRVIVIHHGLKVLDTSVQDLKRHFFHHRLVSLRLRAELDGIDLDGVEVLKRKGRGLKLRVDVSRTSMEDLIRHLLDHGGIEDINVTHPPLEEVIAHIYQTQRPPEP